MDFAFSLLKTWGEAYVGRNVCSFDMVNEMGGFICGVIIVFSVGTSR